MTSKGSPESYELTRLLGTKEGAEVKVVRHKRCATITCIALLIVLVLVAATAGVLVWNFVFREGDSNACRSGDLASVVTSRMNENEDPCEDFYQFACGGFDLSARKMGYITYSTLFQAVSSTENSIKNLLNNNFDTEGVPALQKVKDLYHSCMDTSAINARGVQPLRDLIAMTGGWRTVNIPNEEGQYPSWDINGPQFRMEKLLGSPAFFQIGVSPDPEDSSRFMLRLQQSGLTLPAPQYYTDPEFKDEVERELRNGIIEVLLKLDSSGYYDTAAQQIVSFEERLARDFVPLANTSDVEQTTNIMTLEALNTIWPYFDWIGIIQGMLSTVGVTVSDSERINVLTPSFFTALGNTLSNISDNVTLENYAKWHLIRQFVQFLDEESMTLHNLLREVATGESADEDRSQTCISTVETLLPFALARLYAEHVFPSGAKEMASAIIEEVKVALTERIESRDWLDDYSRQQSKKKVDAFTEWVGYPSIIFNDTFLNDLYAQYLISTDDYFGNYLEYVNISIRTNLANLGQPVNRTKFMAQSGIAVPTTVNSFYYPPFNRIAILMGIMTSPFFQLGWPEYYTYGALGAVMGHEMVHGFDNNGRQYDPDGDYHQWWSNSSIQNYKDLQRCFINQYSNYEMFNQTVNGLQTLGENIADNGGIKASFQAYKNVVNKTGTPCTLKGLSYTHDQIFFIAWAQGWCTYYNATYGAQVYIPSRWTDVHSPGPVRVTGPLVNNPDFAQAFNCPAGGSMNPTNKCLLW